MYTPEIMPIYLYLYFITVTTSDSILHLRINFVGYTYTDCEFRKSEFSGIEAEIHYSSIEADLVVHQFVASGVWVFLYEI